MEFEKGDLVTIVSIPYPTVQSIKHLIGCSGVIISGGRDHSKYLVDFGNYNKWWFFPKNLEPYNEYTIIENEYCYV